MGNSFEELTDLNLVEHAQHDQYLLVLGPDHSPCGLEINMERSN